MLKFKKMIFIFLILLVFAIPHVSAESSPLNHSMDCESSDNTVIVYVDSLDISCDVYNVSLDEGVYDELEQESVFNDSNTTGDIVIDVNNSFECGGLNGEIISGSDGVKEHFTISSSGMSGIFNLNAGSTLILSNLDFIVEKLDVGLDNTGGLLFGDNIFFISTIVNLQNGDIFTDISLIGGNIHFINNFTSNNLLMDTQNKSAVNSEDNSCTTEFYNLFTDFNGEIIISGHKIIFQFNIADLGNKIVNEFINITNSAIDFADNITEESAILGDFPTLKESKNITLGNINTLNSDDNIAESAVKSGEAVYNNYVNILSSFDVNIKGNIAGVYGGALFLICEAFINNVDL